MVGFYGNKKWYNSNSFNFMPKWVVAALNWDEWEIRRELFAQPW